MDIGKIAKDVIKNGAIMFAVGALLAVVAPTLGSWVGLTDIAGSHTANPAWMGAFFGAFGAIHAILTPLVTAIFGKDAEPALTAANEKQPQVVVQIKQETEIAPDKAKSHAAALQNERAAAVCNPKVPAI